MKRLKEFISKHPRVKRTLNISYIELRYNASLDFGIALLIVLLILIVTFSRTLTNLVTNDQILVGSVIGALISGVIGIFAGRYERHLVRKEKHHDQIKATMEVIKGSLIKFRNTAYPYTSEDKGKAWCVKGTKADELYWNSFSLLNYQDAIRIDKDTIQMRAVDKIWYKDIERHSNTLYEALEGINKNAPVDGLNLNNLYYDLIENVFTENAASTILVRKLGTDFPLPISKTGNEDYYASAVMNIILETDPSEWSVMHQKLVADTTLNDIENLAQSTKSKYQTLYTQLTTQRDTLFKSIDNCISQLDNAIRQKHLNHSCPWT